MSWLEVRDRSRLWCRIDPERRLLEIVHRRERKVIDLAEYGLVFVGTAAEERPPAGREPPETQ